MTLQVEPKQFIDNQMSSNHPRVQYMSWHQHTHKDPNPNRAKPTPLHPPTHKYENLLAQESTTKQVAVKPIRMGGDVL